MISQSNLACCILFLYSLLNLSHQICCLVSLYTTNRHSTNCADFLWRVQSANSIYMTNPLLNIIFFPLQRFSGYLLISAALYILNILSFILITLYESTTISHTNFLRNLFYPNLPNIALILYFKFYIIFFNL